MRVMATAAGHASRIITVERKRKTRQGVVTEEIPADYILPGDIFEWEDELGRWMQPLETPTLDRKGIIAKLDAAGIAYFKGAKTDALAALLPKE